MNLAKRVPKAAGHGCAALAVMVVMAGAEAAEWRLNGYAAGQDLIVSSPKIRAQKSGWHGLIDATHGGETWKYKYAYTWKQPGADLHANAFWEFRDWELIRDAAKSKGGIYFPDTYTIPEWQDAQEIWLTGGKSFDQAFQDSLQGWSKRPMDNREWQELLRRIAEGMRGGTQIAWEWSAYPETTWKQSGMGDCVDPIKAEITKPVPYKPSPERAAIIASQSFPNAYLGFGDLGYPPAGQTMVGIEIGTTDPVFPMLADDCW